MSPSLLPSLPSSTTTIVFIITLFVWNLFTVVKTLWNISALDLDLDLTSVFRITFIFHAVLRKNPQLIQQSPQELQASPWEEQEGPRDVHEGYRRVHGTYMRGTRGSTGHTGGSTV